LSRDSTVAVVCSRRSARDQMCRRPPPRCPTGNHHSRTGRDRHDRYANALDWPSRRFSSHLLSSPVHMLSTPLLLQPHLLLLQPLVPPLLIVSASDNHTTDTHTGIPQNDSFWTPFPAPRQHPGCHAIACCRHTHCTQHTHTRSDMPFGQSPPLSPLYALSPVPKTAPQTVTCTHPKTTHFGPPSEHLDSTRGVMPLRAVDIHSAHSTLTHLQACLSDSLPPCPLSTHCLRFRKQRHMHTPQNDSFWTTFPAPRQHPGCHAIACCRHTQCTLTHLRACLSASLHPCPPSAHCLRFRQPHHRHPHRHKLLGPRRGEHATAQ
jgi:hypothetical protein